MGRHTDVFLVYIPTAPTEILASVKCIYPLYLTVCFCFNICSLFFHSWDYFSHDHARSRAYRWGEDGLLGITDRECRLCFGLALWNEKDPILKERLFGLTGTEGENLKGCQMTSDELLNSPSNFPCICL